MAGARVDTRNAMIDLHNYLISSPAFTQSSISLVIKEMAYLNPTAIPNEVAALPFLANIQSLASGGHFASNANNCFTYKVNKVRDVNKTIHEDLKELIRIIRKKIGFKNILISDDLSMKSLKRSIKQNTIRAFNSGCNLVLHCNANYKEMQVIAKNSPLISKFIKKKTSQFYKVLS